MFKRFYEKFLPVCIRLWPLHYCFIAQSKPTHYHSHGMQGHRRETYWQALRIIIGYDEHNSRSIFTIKKGFFYL